MSLVGAPFSCRMTTALQKQLPDESTSNPSYPKKQKVVEKPEKAISTMQNKCQFSCEHKQPEGTKEGQGGLVVSAGTRQGEVSMLPQHCGVRMAHSSWAPAAWGCTASPGVCT